MIRTSVKEVMFKQISVRWKAQLPRNNRFTIKRNIIKEFNSKGITIEKGTQLRLYIDGIFKGIVTVGKDNRIQTPDPETKEKQTITLIAERPH